MASSLLFACGRRGEIMSEFTCLDKCWLSRSASAHGVEKVAVVLGDANLVDQELGGLEIVHRVQQLAQYPHLLKYLRLDEQFLAARAGTIDVDRGENALLVHSAVEVDFHVAGSLELLIDHVVHPGTRVDERGGQDGERAAFLDVARRSGEAL